MKYKIIGKYIKNLDFKIPNPKIFSLLSIKISLHIIGSDAAILVKSLNPPALY